MTAVDSVLVDDAPEVSRSYARALVGAAEKAGPEAVATVLDDLAALQSEVLATHPELAAVLDSPLVATADKDHVLVATLEGRVAPTVLQFLRVLNRHGRLGHLGPIVRTARAVWDRKQDRRPVAVRSAVPLDDAQQAALRDRLARMLDATPVLAVVVDPALIGGLIVQVGDDVYDASVRNHLEQLRYRLIEGKTHEIQGRRDQFSHSE